MIYVNLAGIACYHASREIGWRKGPLAKPRDSQGRPCCAGPSPWCRYNTHHPGELHMISLNHPVKYDQCLPRHVNCSGEREEDFWVASPLCIHPRRVRLCVSIADVQPRRRLLMHESWGFSCSARNLIQPGTMRRLTTKYVRTETWSHFWMYRAAAG